MKKIVSLLAIIGFFTLQSCEGPQGPMGPPGHGDGDTIAEVFEITASFTPDNNYQVFANLNPPIYSSDVVLVYELAGVYNGQDIWKQLPQVYTFNEGLLQYNFDFTRYDLSLYLDATFNPLILSSNWRHNKVFRVVIVPGAFSAKVDTSDYYNVIEFYNIKTENIKKLQ